MALRLHQLMAYNNNALKMENLKKQICQKRDCPEQCCNRKGQCLTHHSADPDQNTCYHYYPNPTTLAPSTRSPQPQPHIYIFPAVYAIPLIIIGCLVVVILLVLLWRCWKIKQPPEHPSTRHPIQSDNQLQSQRHGKDVGKNWLTTHISEDRNAVIFRIPLDRSPPSPYTVPPGQPYPQYHAAMASLEENINNWRYYEKQITRGGELSNTADKQEGNVGGAEAQGHGEEAGNGGQAQKQ